MPIKRNTHIALLAEIPLLRKLRCMLNCSQPAVFGAEPVSTRLSERIRTTICVCERISQRHSLRVCCPCQMSNRVRNYLPVLRRTNKLGNKAKRDFVRKCDRGFLDCISECAKNVLKGNVPLTDRQKMKLRRSQNDLRELSTKKTALQNKRRILQKGGFLTALLPPILGVLANLLLLK